VNDPIPGKTTPSPALPLQGKGVPPAQATAAASAVASSPYRGS